MELLESDDPKSLLLKKSILQRNALDDEARLISARTEKVITNALIIGGALAATYFLVRQFSGSKKKSKGRVKKIKVVAATPAQQDEAGETEVQAPGIVTQIGTALAAQAGAFLLTLAKEKLTEYLESQMEKKTADNERS
jgi:hypothetical protein